jgi:YVTN family beta-propeller protein
MVRESDLRPFERRRTGRRPTALATSPDGRRIYVVNTSDDSVTVLDVAGFRVRTTVPLGPPVERTTAERGEELFHDATLSLDRWYSCQSCHTDGHSNGLLTDNFSDGAAGAAKRVLPLGGSAEGPPWAWNGSSPSLESQVRKSIVVTQQGEDVADEIVTAIAAYIETLRPVPSLSAARGMIDAEAVKRGREVFSAQGCAECHRPPTYTSDGVYDVGLDDGRGGRKFNPPTLRGVSQRDALFHDGRARSLEQVLGRFGHGGADALTPAERADLLKFLRSL